MQINTNISFSINNYETTSPKHAAKYKKSSALRLLLGIPCKYLSSNAPEKSKIALHTKEDGHVNIYSHIPSLI
jgi:hypothetical protein